MCKIFSFRRWNGTLQTKPRQRPSTLYSMRQRKNNRVGLVLSPFSNDILTEYWNYILNIYPEMNALTNFTLTYMLCEVNDFNCQYLLNENLEQKLVICKNKMATNAFFTHGSTTPLKHIMYFSFCVKNYQSPVTWLHLILLLSKTVYVRGYHVANKVTC